MAKRTEIVVELRLEDKGAVSRLGELKIQTKEFARELAALQKTIAKQGFGATPEQINRVGELGARIRNAGVQIRELENRLSGAAAAGLRFRDKMADAAKAGLGAFGLNILTVSGAIAGLVSVVKGAVTTIADFEKALSNVSALGGDYAARIGEISEATKTAGIAFGFTAVESVAAVEALAKAGVAVEDILGGGLEGALTLAAAGSLDVATAAEAAAKAMVQFGLAGQDVTHIADLFANSANKALGEVSDITAALNQSGQVANQFGVSIEETVGTLTAFANAGLLGSDAGTSFRTMLIRLAKPTDDSVKLMDQLGIKAFDAQGAFVGIENLAGQLQTQLKGLTEEQRNSALATIFGTDAIRSASILYEGGAESIAKWTKEVSESGEAARIAQEKTNNLQGDLDKLSASYDALILGGGGLSDVLRSITQGLTDQIEAASKAENIFLSLGALFDANLARNLGALQAIDEAQKKSQADATAFFGDRAAQLEKLSELEERRAEFIAAGNLKGAASFDEEIAALNRLIATTKEETAVVVEGVKADEVATEQTEKKTIKVKELTAAQKELLAIQQQISDLASGKDTLTKPLQDLGLPSNDTDTESDAEKSARITAETTAANIAQFDLERQAFQDLQDAKLAAVAGFAFALSSLAEEGSAEAKFLFALEKAAAIAQVIISLQREIAANNANPFWSSLPDGGAILKTAANTAARIRAGISVATIAATAIEGFAEGGKVKQSDGPRYTKNKGDSVLISAAPDEVILNEPQQARLKRLFGRDVFRQIGVPGFAGGGGVGNYVRFVRGQGIGQAPRPSTGEIVNLEAMAETRAINFAPTVSVVEINNVQNRTRVIENLSTA